MSTATAAAAITPAAEQKLEEKFYQIATGALQPSPLNPRKTFPQAELDELARSIAARGILQPLLVRPRPDHTYEIIAGECRWRAAKLANLMYVPCLVRMMTDAAVLEAMIIENLQRHGLSPLEEAASYQALLKATNDSLSQPQPKLGVADIAARIGKSPRYVYDRLELLKLSADAKEALAAGYISAGHAAELVRLNSELQAEALNQTIRKALSVIGLRIWIADAKSGPTARASAALAGARHADDGRVGAEVQRLSRTSASTKSHVIPTAPTLHKSYSGDLIPSGKIRAPFAIGDELWCNTGGEGTGDGVSVVNLEAYRVVMRSKFSGRTRSYNTRALQGDKARNDRKGFYHGVRVSFGGHEFVLCGPPKLFPRDPEEITAAQEARPEEQKRFSRYNIERAIRTTLHRVVGDLRLERLTPARKRGEWLAVIVERQKPELHVPYRAPAAKRRVRTRRRAHGKRRK